MRLVVDASVIVKWLLADSAREPDTERAIALMRRIVAGEAELLMPPHWLAEVAAVLVRHAPESAAASVERLVAMEWPVENGSEVFRVACDLSRSTGQHVFDTLYHAVALTTPDAVLVTADDRYRRAAKAHGRIRPLAEMPR